MKRKQISALLLSSTLIVSNVTPTLAAAVQGSGVTVSTQETTETSEESDSLDEMQGDLPTSPETTPEVTTTPDEDVEPEVTPEPDVMTEATPENTPEVTPEATPEVTPAVEKEVTPEVTPEVETPATSEVPAKEEEAPVSDNKTEKNTMSVLADVPEDTTKPEIGAQFEVDVDNMHYVCKVEAENTIVILSGDVNIGADCKTVVIPSSISYANTEYSVKKVNDVSLSRVDNLIISEGISSYLNENIEIYELKTMSIPASLKEFQLNKFLPDGTQYINIYTGMRYWVESVTIAESNPYLKFDKDRNIIYRSAAPEIGSNFEVDVDNIHYICKVTSDNTVDIESFDGIRYEDHTTVVIPATINCRDKAYTVNAVKDIGFEVIYSTKSLTLSEGISKFTANDIDKLNLDTLTLPTSLEKIYFNATLPDGTRYLDTEGWVKDVILPDSNPYLRYDMDNDKIFSKIEEVGPELNVGDTFKKGIFEYEVVEPGVVDMIGFLTMNATVGEIPGTLTYKSHEYKVRDCHVEEYKHYCRKMTRLSFDEGIRNVYWGYDPNVSSVVTIQHLEYPSSLELIDYNPDLPALQSITIPDSSTQFKTVDGILYNKDLTELLMYPASKVSDVYTVPASVTTIRENAFVHTSGIKELIIPNTVKVMEDGAIVFTKGIEKIEIGSGIESINQCLYGCKGLKTAVIKMRVSYPQSFLSDCPDLEEVYLDGPENLGYGVLEDLPSLKAYHVTNSSWLSSVDGVLCSKNEEVLIKYPANKEDTMFVVPDKVELITSQAFLNTKNLETLVLPKGVELYGSVVENPERPLDVYVRDTESIKVNAANEPLFVSQVGGNVYVPNQTVLDNVQNGNMTNGMAASVKVIPITSLTLDSQVLEPVKGSTVQVKASFEPYYATEEIKWSSEDKNIASVDQDGNITAHKAGNTRIVASVAAKTCTVQVNVKVPLESIRLNKESMELNKGTSATLQVSFNPEDTTDSKDITWESSNKAVATVDGNGKVTAISVGDTEIIARGANGTVAKCQVSVKSPLESISMNKTSDTMNRGEKQKLSVTYNPEDTTDSKALTWESSNASVVKVEKDGTVSAVGAGKATITAKGANGTQTSCEIEVKVPLTGITMAESKTMNKGTSSTLDVTYDPEDTTDSKTLSWESSNAAIVKVDKTGKITAVAPGTATITAKGVNGVTASCKITVKAPLTSIEILGDKTELNRGEVLDLDVKYNPADTTDSKEIAWSVSDHKILAVDAAGVVTAKAPGTALVYAKGANNTMDSFEITVKAPLESISLDKVEMTLTEGTGSKLLVNYNPTDTTDAKSVTWTSSAKDIVSVDKDGNVSAHKPGTATITAKVGNKTATCKITVTKRVIALDSIEITTPNVSLEEEEITKLQVVYNPANTTVDRTVTWTSSDKSVASVDKNGNVTAHKAGTAAITAKVGDKTATCTVKVNKKEVALESIVMNFTALNLKVGTQGELAVTYNPTNTTVDRTVTWTSSDKSVASVDKNGKVTAHKAGTATIMAKVGNKTATCVVTVEKEEVALESITLDQKNLNLKINSSETLKVSYNPSNTTVDKTVAWSSSDKSVASVDKNGKVTAHKAGTATITAKVGNKTATCVVTVEKNEIALESIALNQKNLSLTVNGSETLKVSYNPSNTTVDKTVAWSSSDKSVASVDKNGKVTAHKPGSTTITAKVGNKTASCVVNVKKAEIALDSIALDQESLNLELDHSKTLKVSYNPSNTTVDKTVTWSSSDESVVSVDANGKVTAHKAGRVTITARVGNKEATCIVTVKKISFADAEISLSNHSYIYDGKAKKPSVTVQMNGKEIKDYSVTYSNNVNAGTAKVTITATGNYEGTKELTFKIQKADMADAIISGISNKTFNGKAQTQSVSVKVNGHTLSSGEYTVSYKNNVQPGTATMTITGKGNYTGSKNCMFKVNMKAGWTQVGTTWYYGNSNGTMVKDGWVSGYYMDKNGVWVPGAQPPQWIKSGNRWWYRHMDGSYTRSNWEQIKGKWYYFDASGWMLTGWQFVNGRWYYMDASGAMQTGWQKIKGTWYYMNESGAMLTGWVYVGNKWYYMNSSGAMQTGWKNVNGRWYYMDASGAMQTGWKFINNKWYYMNSSGAMLTGWQKINGRWYLLSGSGAMLTGWQKVNGTWYYMYSNGAMAENTWVGRYYVNASGAWIKTR